MGIVSFYAFPYMKLRKPDPKPTINLAIIKDGKNRIIFKRLPNKLKMKL